MIINNDIIESIDVTEEIFFSYKGCDNCNNKLGNTVTEVKCYFNKFTDYYEINLCDECIIYYHYGDNLSIDCKNIYKI